MAYSAPSITASGTTFTQFLQGGPNGHLENLITVNAAARSAPVTAATVSATGVQSTGGSFAAGVYKVVFTEVNGIGETTASPESAAMTVAAGNQPLITFPALQTGNISRNLYIGPAGAEVLYATGLTAVTTAVTAAAPTNSFAVSAPTVNTTGFTWSDANGNQVSTPYSLVRAAERGNLQDAWKFLQQVVRDFNSGQPVTWPSAIQKLRHAHTVFAMMSTMCSEMGTLIDANAGTLKTQSVGVGYQTGYRSQP